MPNGLIFFTNRSPVSSVPTSEVRYCTIRQHSGCPAINPIPANGEISSAADAVIVPVPSALPLSAVDDAISPPLSRSLDLQPLHHQHLPSQLQSSRQPSVQSMAKLLPSVPQSLYLWPYHRSVCSRWHNCFHHSESCCTCDQHTTRHHRQCHPAIDHHHR